jgi:WD40 repeat protein
VSQSDLNLHRDEKKPLAPGVRQVDWSANGELIAIGTTNETVYLWSMIKKGIVGELCGHTKGVTAVAFHPRKSLLVTASFDLTLRMWHIGNGNTDQE